jgi:hypothetical protein
MPKNMFCVVGDCVEMDLTRGHVGLVDYSTWERIYNTGWCEDKGYMAGKVSGRKVELHRLLTPWDYIDHINRNSLDNRIGNLRSATHSQNMANQPPQTGA